MFLTMLDPNAELSTAQLAERTGVHAATLRMWESRHGFPVPARRPGGHRRYSDQDVEAVREVLALRGHGLSLTAAIERVRRPAGSPQVSIFAGLRQRRPEVPTTVLPKPLVLALSHAIEDEYCAHGASGLVIGSFQRESFYRGAERRWRELARTADLAVALAEFDELRSHRGAPVEIPIGRRHALAREWALIVDAPGAHACLAAWEQLAEHELADADRRFEVMWSFEPAVVATAVEVATDLLTPLAPDVAALLAQRSESRPTVATGDLRFASALSQRIVGYLTTTIRESRVRRPDKST